jgi:hypothetical protein
MTDVIHIQRLVVGIYEVYRSDALSFHDTQTKFHKDWFRHSDVNNGDSQTHRQHRDRISLL